MPAASPTPRPRVLPSGESRPRYDLERLLEVAVSVFTERGYDGTSVEHLARASGLSKSSIYHHIESKEQLLRLALERALDPLLASTEDDGARTGRAVERLTHLVKRDVEILAERLPYVTLLLRVHGNTETERWALAQRRGFDKIVAGLVQEAVDEGDIRPGVDAVTTARLLFGMVNSLVEWYRPGRDLGPDRIADQILAMVLDGIRTPGSATTNGRAENVGRTRMSRIFTTSFASVYPHYVTKVEKKGRTKAELDQVIEWLTGFDQSALKGHLAAGTTLEDFFAAARLNPHASLITGVVCGVRVEHVDDPLMQKIRWLDKLVDELAKGKPMEKVLRA